MISCILQRINRIFITNLRKKHTEKHKELKSKRLILGKIPATPSRTTKRQNEKTKRRHIMKLLMMRSVVALLLIVSAPSKSITPVDVELQLLIDISGSVNTTEYDLQLQGYVNAFRSDRVQQAIINGTEGQIAVQMIMWSGQNAQDISLDWTLIDSAGSADLYADNISAIARPFAGWTAIGSAIEYGYPLFSDNGFNGTSLVMDVSGDGTNNQGIAPDTARDNALANGIDTINGIVITSNQNVIDQYLNDVVGGDTPFLLAPAGFAEFQQAIENKIVAEIEGTIPENNQVVQVPEPSSVILFGLSGLFMFISRKKKEK